MIGLSMVVWLGGCGFSLPESPKCDEPHLYYAPAPATDVYFGCEPPLGWLSTPPDEARFEPAPVVEAPDDAFAPSLSVDEVEPEPEEPDPLSQVRHDTASVLWAGTGETGDTALDESRPERRPDDTGARPSGDDTGAEPPPDTSDTGSEPGDDTGGDTGAEPRGDDTGAEPPPPNGDTGAPPPPPRDTGAPPPPVVDTGSR